MPRPILTPADEYGLGLHLHYTAAELISGNPGIEQQLATCLIRASLEVG